MGELALLQQRRMLQLALVHRETVPGTHGLFFVQDSDLNHMEIAFKVCAEEFSLCTICDEHHNIERDYCSWGLISKLGAPYHLLVQIVRPTLKRMPDAVQFNLWYIYSVRLPSPEGLPLLIRRSRGPNHQEQWKFAKGTEIQLLPHDPSFCVRLTEYLRGLWELLPEFAEPEIACYVTDASCDGVVARRGSDVDR